MPDLPISGLPAVTSLTAPDLLVVVQAGVTSQVTVSNSKKQIINPTAKTSNYNLSADDEMILFNAASGNLSAFLPTAVGAQGKNYIIKKVDTSDNTVTIVPDGSETIDAASNYVLLNGYESVKITSNGSNWLTI